MKNKLIAFTALFLISILFISCEDRSELTSPEAPNLGSTNFAAFVAIGNSITAGYQSGSLYEDAQMYSYPNLIAKQVGTEFIQPIISNPGTVGRMEIKSLNPFTITYNTNGGTLTNPTAPYYNNFGVPGIVLADVLSATSMINSFSKSPFLDLILRGKGTIYSQIKDLSGKKPTFITIWIGNNDVLGFATSGGVKPTLPTDPNVFGFLYSALADSIASIGAKVVVANIPDVTAIPFFTTVGPAIAQKLSSLGITGMYYQLHGHYSGSVIPVSALANFNVLITLLGQNYAGLIGTPTGKFYKDNNVDITPLIAGGILDTTKLFGLDPKNPWPDALILDASEITTAKNATSAYNNYIAGLANSKGFGLVDINSIFNQIRSNDFAGGTVYDGVVFTTTYITGGLFSLDAVHPSNQGHAIVANEFIKVINAKWGAKIPLINVSTIPGSLIFAKQNPLFSLKFEDGSFDHLLF